MKKTICDDIAARELFLYAVNKEDLHCEIRSVLKCLYRKAMKGQYIIDKASDAFAGVVKSAAIMYTAEFGSGRYYDTFNAATRKEVCRQLEDYFHEDVTKVRYTVELESELDKPLRVWLKNRGISFDTSGCGTLDAPRTHFKMLMDEETAKSCQEFVDKL